MRDGQSESPAMSRRELSRVLGEKVIDEPREGETRPDHRWRGDSGFLELPESGESLLASLNQFRNALPVDVIEML